MRLGAIIMPASSPAIARVFEIFTIVLLFSRVNGLSTFCSRRSNGHATGQYRSQPVVFTSCDPSSAANPESRIYAGRRKCLQDRCARECFGDKSCHATARSRQRLVGAAQSLTSIASLSDLAGVYCRNKSAIILSFGEDPRRVRKTRESGRLLPEKIDSTGRKRFLGFASK